MGKIMVKKSEILFRLKQSVVKANLLRAFTAITCSVIAGMVSIILYLASLWHEAALEQKQTMQDHTETLNKILLAETKINDKIDNQNNRIDDNKNNVHFALDSIQDIRLQVAEIKGELHK